MNGMTMTWLLTALGCTCMSVLDFGGSHINIEPGLDNPYLIGITSEIGDIEAESSVIAEDAVKI